MLSSVPPEWASWLILATDFMAAVGLVTSVPAWGEQPSVRGVAARRPSGVAPTAAPAGI